MATPHQNRKSLRQLARSKRTALRSAVRPHTNQIVSRHARHAQPPRTMSPAIQHALTYRGNACRARHYLRVCTLLCVCVCFRFS